MIAIPSFSYFLPVALPPVGAADLPTMPTTTFAKLLALHALIGDALDDIHRVFSQPLLTQMQVLQLVRFSNREEIIDWVA
jgi:hypothetical protein